MAKEKQLFTVTEDMADGSHHVWVYDNQELADKVADFLDNDESTDVPTERESTVLNDLPRAYKELHCKGHKFEKVPKVKGAGPTNWKRCIHCDCWRAE